MENNEELGQYLRTLEEQVKAQALLITKLQSEVIVFKKRADKFETEINTQKKEEE